MFIKFTFIFWFLLFGTEDILNLLLSSTWSSSSISSVEALKFSCSFSARTWLCFSMTWASCCLQTNRIMPSQKSGYPYLCRAFLCRAASWLLGSTTSFFAADCWGICWGFLPMLPACCLLAAGPSPLGSWTYGTAVGNNLPASVFLLKLKIKHTLWYKNKNTCTEQKWERSHQVT